MYANKIRRKLSEREFFVFEKIRNRLSMQPVCLVITLGKNCQITKPPWIRRVKGSGKTPKRMIPDHGSKGTGYDQYWNANPDRLSRTDGCDQKADKALYKAKDQGRNCVVVAPDSDVMQPHWKLFYESQAKSKA